MKTHSAPSHIDNIDRRQFLTFLVGASLGVLPDSCLGVAPNNTTIAYPPAAYPELKAVIRKSRLYLPREFLSASSNVIITAGPRRQLLLLSIENWDLMRSKILTQPGSAAIKRIVVGNAREEVVDHDGSIILEEELLEFANLRQNVNLIRREKLIEIWAS